MTAHVALLPDPVPAPPWGLVAPVSKLADLTRRATRLGEMKLAVIGAHFVLYQGPGAEPDLPYLGADVSYVRTLGGGLLGPMGMRLSLNVTLVDRFREVLRERYGMQGDVMLAPGGDPTAPLQITDLANALPVARVDIAALMAEHHL